MLATVDEYVSLFYLGSEEVAFLAEASFALAKIIVLYNERLQFRQNSLL